MYFSQDSNFGSPTFYGFIAERLAQRGPRWPYVRHFENFYFIFKVLVRREDNLQLMRYDILAFV